MLFQAFRDRASQQPTADAVVHNNRRLSYSELDQIVVRVSAGLRDIGLTPGGRVLMYARNSPEILATYLAVGRAGGVFAPVNAGFRERELRYIIGNAEPDVVIVESELLDRLWNVIDEPHHPAHLVVLGEPISRPGGLSTFALWDAFGIGIEDPGPLERSGDDGALICYTSGTTSRPKPVLHSHSSEVYSVQAHGGVWDLGEDDRGIVCLPLSWLYGLSTTSIALLVGGGTVLMLDRFHPLDVLREIESERATAMFGTMSMYAKMLEVLETQPFDLSSLRLLVNGGEPSRESTVAAFERRAGRRLLEAWSTSEARPLIMQAPTDELAPRGTCGRPLPDTELRLMSADGTKTMNDTGVAEARCPGMMSAYFNEPELTAERVTTDGWLRTGDVLRRDDSGYFFVVGRDSEMIIRSGVNIAPAEIEGALAEHTGVREAVVVGIPDPRSGEAVSASVVAGVGPALTPDGLRAFLVERLASYKIPQHFRFVDELPRNVSGKIDRAAVRDGAVQHSSATVKRSDEISDGSAAPNL